MKKIIINLVLLTWLIIPIAPVIAANNVPITTPAPTQQDCSGASGLCLNVPIGSVKVVSGFEEYIQLWYSFVVGVVGILATVIIMWGGFKWLTSRGNAAAIGDAKDRIWSAVIGLVLVFLSYNLLWIINRNLLTISLPTLETTRISNIEAMRQEEPQGQDLVSGTPINGAQQTTNLTTFTDSGIDIANGQIRLDGLTQETMDVTQQIRNEFGQNITITSGYRPQSTGSQHAVGRAVDVARSPEFDNFMRTEVIGDAQPAWYYRGQPGYEVTYNGVNIRVIDETINNVWHIDTKPR